MNRGRRWWARSTRKTSIVHRRHWPWSCERQREKKVYTIKWVTESCRLYGLRMGKKQTLERELGEKVE
jgi:hypothetical protein